MKAWMSPRRRRSALALVVLGLLLTVAGACEPASAPATPILDTYVTSASPTRADHESDHIYVRNDAKVHIGYLRFRVAGVPDGTYWATLRLTPIEGGKNIWVHNAGPATRSTSYANRPGLRAKVGFLSWTQRSRPASVLLSGVTVAGGVVNLGLATSSPGQVRILSTEGARARGDVSAAPTLQLFTSGDGPTPSTTAPPTTAPPTTAAPTTAPPTTAAPTTAPPTTRPPSTSRQYPWHTNIVSTTFWVGELFDASAEDGSQVCSTYDANWAFHWSGIRTGTVPASAPGCPGSPTGGCDGVVRGGVCATERRTAANGYFPTSATPRENPFYLDLPYDDLNDARGFRDRCTNVPWADDPGYAGHCRDRSFSYMKNRWVELVGPNGATCYGQIQDAGPNVYDDARYVFGTTDARPASTAYNSAGMDVSPALNGCLGYRDLDGASDRVSWRFVEAVDVPAGPWLRIVTTSGVDNG